MNATIRHLLCAAGAVLALLAASPGRAALVNYAWSTVGDPGNAPDPSTTGSYAGPYGSVNYVYNIGTYDVTAGQYTAFLNAVAATDPYGLYDPLMGTIFPSQYGTNLGIIQNGTSGHYSYSVNGNPNVPMFYEKWGDAARFANWMQNGQPTNLGEAAGSTETGAYTLNGAVTDAALMEVSRNPGATIFLPTQDEWYKAAYYKGGGTNAGYWLYPTQSNSAPSNVLSTTGTNNANYNTNPINDPTNPLTPVGYFAGSPGAYGTYDMGGDVFQWNETAIGTTGRFFDGGSFIDNLGSMTPSQEFGVNPTGGIFPSGFRLASVPEPDCATLSLIAAVGLLVYRRRLAGRGANRSASA